MTKTEKILEKLAELQALASPLRERDPFDAGDITLTEAARRVEELSDDWGVSVRIRKYDFDQKPSVEFSADACGDHFTANTMRGAVEKAESAVRDRLTVPTVADASRVLASIPAA